MNPCPFCGGEAEVFRQYSSWWFMCCACGSTGPRRQSLREATAAWDSRTPEFAFAITQDTLDRVRRFRALGPDQETILEICYRSHYPLSLEQIRRIEDIFLRERRGAEGAD